MLQASSLSDGGGGMPIWMTNVLKSTGAQPLSAPVIVVKSPMAFVMPGWPAVTMMGCMSGSVGLPEEWQRVQRAVMSGAMSRA